MEIQSGPTRVATPQTKTQDTSTKRELPQTGRAAELQRLNNEASTLKSQSDINTRAVDTPIRKPEPTTVTQNSPIIEVQPTTYVVTQLPERPDIEQDTRVLKINSLISYLRQEAQIASEFEHGAKVNVNRTQQEIDESGFFMWATGGLEGLRQTLEQDKKLLKIREEDRKALKESLKTSEDNLTSFKNLELEGRRLEKAGRLDEAQDCYNKAQERFKIAAAYIGESLKTRVDSSIEVQEVINGLAQANNTLANAEQNLDRTETGLRIARNIAITTGATVATGGMATVCVGAGYGLTATFAISVATGTATGVGIGALSSTAEVVNSNRTFSEGTELILKNAVGDAKTAAIASLAAASGMTFSNVIAKPGSAILVSNTKRIFLAASSGGVASATTKLVEIPIEYVEAVVDFQEQYGDRPKEERDELYKQFMAERRLSWKQIGYDAAIDIAVGFLSAGVGGKCKISEEAKKTFLRKLSTESADAAAGVFIGLGAAYAKNGELTFEDCISELGNATSGFAQGYMTERQRSTTPYKDGEIKIGNKKVTITATQPTNDGFGVVKVSEPEVLQKMYEAVRAREVGNELASREAQGVVGFCDTAKRQVIVLNDPNGVITKSIELHEKIHADGAKLGNSVEQEINAYKAQLAYLQKNGFTIDFTDKGAFIRELGSQEEPPKIDGQKIDEIKRFIEKNIDTESRYPTAKTESTPYEIPLPDRISLKEKELNGELFLHHLNKQYLESGSFKQLPQEQKQQRFGELQKYTEDVRARYKIEIRKGDSRTFEEFLIDDLKRQPNNPLHKILGQDINTTYTEYKKKFISRDVQGFKFEQTGITFLTYLQKQHETSFTADPTISKVRGEYYKSAQARWNKEGRKGTFTDFVINDLAGTTNPNLEKIRTEKLHEKAKGKVAEYIKEIKQRYNESGTNQTFAEYLIADLNSPAQINNPLRQMLGTKIRESYDSYRREITKSCQYESVEIDKTSPRENNPNLDNVIFRDICTDDSQLSLDGKSYAQKKLGADIAQQVIDTDGTATLIRGPKGSALNYIKTLDDVSKVREYKVGDGNFRKFIYEDTNGRSHIVLECSSSSHGYAKQIYGCCELAGIKKENIHTLEARFPTPDKRTASSDRLGKITVERYKELFHSFNIEPDCILIGDTGKFFELNNLYKIDENTHELTQTVIEGPDCIPIKTDNFKGWLCNVNGKKVLVCQITPYIYGPQMGEFAEAVCDIVKSSGKQIPIVLSGTAGGVGNGLEVGDVVRHSKDGTIFRRPRGEQVDSIVEDLEIKSVETPLVEDKNLIDWFKRQGTNTVMDCEYGFIEKFFSNNPNISKFESIFVISDKPGTEHTIDDRIGTQNSKEIFGNICENLGIHDSNNSPRDVRTESFIAKDASNYEAKNLSRFGGADIALKLPEYIAQDGTARSEIIGLCENYLQYGDNTKFDKFQTFLLTQFNVSIVIEY